MKFDPRDLIPTFNKVKHPEEQFYYGDNRDFDPNVPKLNSSNYQAVADRDDYLASKGDIDAVERINNRRAIQRHGSPTMAKEARLRERTAEKRIALGQVQEEYAKEEQFWRDNNIPEEQIARMKQEREAMHQLHPSQRLANLSAWVEGNPNAIPDPELNNDIQRKDINYLKAKYGNEIAQYAFEKAKEKFRAVGQASRSPISEEYTDSIFNPRNIIAGALKGAGHIAQTGEHLANLALTKSGSEKRAEKAKQIEEKYSKYNDTITGMQDVSTQLDSENRANRNEISELFRKDALAKRLTEYSRDEAMRLSEQDAQKFNWALTEINKELLVNGLGEQIPQLVLGGISAKVGSAIVNGASKKALDQLIKQEVKAIQTGLKAEGVTQSSLNRAREAINQSLSKHVANKELGNTIGSSIGAGSYAGSQDATSAGMDAYNSIVNAEGDELNRIKQSPNFIKLKQENPNLSDREIQLQLGEEARKQASLRSGLTTAISAGVIGSTTERLLAGTYGSSLGRKAFGAVTSPISEGVSEAVEEYGNITEPKLAINKALGTDFYDNPHRYAMNQAQEAGIIGAVSGGAGIVGVARDGIKATIDKTAEVSGKVANKAKTNIEDKIIMEEQSNFNSVFGTSAYTDKEGNVVEGEKGILGKSFDESSFGSKYKELVEITKESPLFKPMYEKHGSNNYTKVINDMYKVYSKARNTLENKSDIKPEEKQELETYVQSFEQVQTELSGAILQDMLDSNKELADNFSKMNQLQQELSNENTTEDRRNEVIDLSLIHI